MSDASPITLGCAGLRSALTIEPSFGCVATSWTINGEELLALPSPREEFLRSTRTGGIPLLYPYANRLRHDRFHCAGREVDLSRELSLKRDASGLPMHGLLLRWPHWVISRQSESVLEARLDWGAHAWLMDAYPFAHTLALRWELGEFEGRAAITISTAIHADQGMAVPVAFGWHPYFLVQSASHAHADLPIAREVSLLASGLPALPLILGEAKAHMAVPVGNAIDALFELPTTQVRAMVSQPHRDLAIDFVDGYRAMQVFSPLGANYIAVEPMTAPTSALTDGTADTVGEGRIATYVFRVHAPCPR